MCVCVRVMRFSVWLSVMLEDKAGVGVKVRNPERFWCDIQEL